MPGAKWVDHRAPAELLYPNRRPPNGIHTWSDRFEDDETAFVDGVLVTTPARTALDIACRYPLGRAVAAIDSLARATRLKLADVELLAERHRRGRGIRAASEVLALVDAGAESPQETRVQIPVYDECGRLVAVIDMGWDDVKVGVDYEGVHHRMTRRQFDGDIRRQADVTELGWDDVRITAADTDGAIVGRVGRARDRRT